MPVSVQPSHTVTPAIQACAVAPQPYLSQKVAQLTRCIALRDHLSPHPPIRWLSLKLKQSMRLVLVSLFANICFTSPFQHVILPHAGSLCTPSRHQRQLSLLCAAQQPPQPCDNGCQWRALLDKIEYEEIRPKLDGLSTEDMYELTDFRVISMFERHELAKLSRATYWYASYFTQAVLTVLLHKHDRASCAGTAKVVNIRTDDYGPAVPFLISDQDSLDHLLRRLGGIGLYTEKNSLIFSEFDRLVKDDEYIVSYGKGSRFYKIIADTIKRNKAMSMDNASYKLVVAAQHVDDDALARAEEEKHIFQN
eukprot:3988-Heterococcus_DN1.PRE.2